MSDAGPAQVVPSASALPQSSSAISPPGPSDVGPASQDSPPASDLMGKGMRPKFPSVKLRDYVTHSICVDSPSPSAPSPSPSSGTPYPLAHYINCTHFSGHYRKFLAAIISGHGPRSFKEAMTDAGWKASMQEEIRALEENGTWALKILPPGKRALSSQWVYRTKFKSNGEIERLKSPLVVLSNH